MREGGGERSSRGTIFIVVPLGASCCKSSPNSSRLLPLTAVSPICEEVGQSIGHCNTDPHSLKQWQNAIHVSRSFDSIQHLYPLVNIIFYLQKLYRMSSCYVVVP